MDSDTRADRLDPIVAELARLRRDRGWSPNELGRRAGVTGRTIRDLEAGNHGPTLYTLRALAAVFGAEIQVRILREHGTAAARARHQYRREPLCDACKRWDRDRKRARRQQAVDGGSGQVAA